MKDSGELKRAASEARKKALVEVEFALRMSGYVGAADFIAVLIIESGPAPLTLVK